MVKNFRDFINESEQPIPPPAPAPAQQPAAQPPAQPPAQPQAQPPVQQAQSSGTTQGQSQGQSTEEKIGDLSNYNNPDATKFSDTVKKMADSLKDMDKNQLLAVRKCIADQKGIQDEKSEIGKL